MFSHGGTAVYERFAVPREQENGGVHYVSGKFRAWCTHCHTLVFAFDTPGEAYVRFQDTHGVTCRSPFVARSQTQAFWLDQLFTGHSIHVPSRHEPKAILGQRRETRASWEGFRSRLCQRGFELRVMRERVGAISLYTAKLKKPIAGVAK